MPHRRITFSKFLIEDRRRAGPDGCALAALLNDVQTACKFIALSVARGSLGDMPLDAVADDIMATTCEGGGQLAGLLSQHTGVPHAIPPAHPRGRYLLVVDPLDGASEADINIPVGTIFSILEMAEPDREAGSADFLQPGARQVAAGYALYGPASMLIATLGSGVQGFTLDREIGAYTLTQPDIRVPHATNAFAMNPSAERHWEPPVRRFVQECLDGAAGPRRAESTIRWSASLVGEMHRILVRGGLFMAPRDRREGAREGHVRLLSQANPMAMLIEQAGGGASTGRERLLDVTPTATDQRIPLFLGSLEEIDRIERYHRSYDAGEETRFTAPLFQPRSLFRTR